MFAVSILAAALTLVLIATIPGDVTALPGHSMEVTITPEVADAKPTYTKLGVAEFWGNVTIDKPQGVERVTITLTAECDRGWPLSLSPETMVFINPRSQGFNLDIIVPPRTQVCQGVATVRASASSPIWEEEQSAECRVNVLQYYRFETWTSYPSTFSDPGDAVSGRLIINNSGNGDDTFSITIEDPPEDIERWTLSQEVVTVAHSLYSEVRFTLYISEDWDVWWQGGSLVITFVVTSEGAREDHILLRMRYPFYIMHQGVEDHVVNEWPTYVGYGVLATLVLAPTVFLVWRRRKRRNEDLGRP